MTEKTFNREAVRLINKTIRRAHDGKVKGVRRHDLNIESLEMLVSADCSFAGYDDLATQHGYVIHLTDSTHRANWIYFGTYNCRGVVCFVLGGETYAFADLFDVSFSLRYDISEILRRVFSLTILTDSESLFKPLVKSSTIFKRRFIIGIRAAHEPSTKTR